MSAAPGKTKFQVDLRCYLRDTNVDRDLTRLICEIADASKYIINSIRTGDLGVAGTSNLYGEEQLALDVLSDRILRKRLIHSGVVSTIVSEETNEIIRVDHSNNQNGGRRFSVAYDPLDGSSLVDVNLAVGTIVAIYDGDNILQAGRHQVAAMYILYGPRTTLVLSTGNGVQEFAMNALMEYTLVNENIRLAQCGSIYSPGGQRNKYSAGTEKFVRHLEEKGAKLRYSGGFVPDINQIMIKGKGIFLYPHLQGAPQGKLRLLYELYPMAYLVEQGGGAASTGKQRILDIIPEKIDDCSPIFIGCKDDVALAEAFIAEHG
jgi:fructose-1,6-bisphosphatase I